MKKTLAVIGGIVTAASIFAVIVVILKKIRLSFTIESADEVFDFDDEAQMNGDISVSIEEDIPFDEDSADISL